MPLGAVGIAPAIAIAIAIDIAPAIAGYWMHIMPTACDIHAWISCIMDASNKRRLFHAWQHALCMQIMRH